MEKKLTIEELEAKYKALGEEIEARKKAEAKKLNAEKDARYKEVINAYENFEELRNKYVEDYGSFTFKTPNGTSTLWNWVFNEV